MCCRRLIELSQLTPVLQTLFKDTEARFQTLIPNIIEVFTLQVDPDKAAQCEYIKQVVKTAINVAIDASIAVVTDGIGGVLTNKLLEQIETKVEAHALKKLGLFDKPPTMPLTAYKKNNKELFDRVKEEYTGKWKAPLAQNLANQGSIFPMFHGPQQWASDIYHPGMFWGTTMAGANDPPEWHSERKLEDSAEDLYAADAADATYLAKHSLFNEAYRDWPRNKLEEIKSQQVASGGDGAFEMALPTITGGTGWGWEMCSDFEGDWQDHNEDNNKILKQRVAVELEAARRQVWTLFKNMYDGELLEPGRPSLLARWMLARNWVGKDKKDSVEYDLYHREDFHK